MIRTKVYYQFLTVDTKSYERMKNTLYQPFPLTAMITDFHRHDSIHICRFFDNQVETDSTKHLSDAIHELFYYNGKKKVSFLIEKPEHTSDGTTCWTIQQKRIL